ncbi:MAG TPA: hypothetical protein DDY98_03370 [Ruminococcaceae bacterium]|nr:hypothetical protein [Oscillospiraceae bacterium]
MNEFKPILRFLAMSDIHFNREKPERRRNFELGIKLAYEYAEQQEYKGIDVLTINGDFTDHGEEEHFADFKESVEGALKPETDLIMTMASHEYMCDGHVEKAHERLRRFFNRGPDNHKVIKGFHFISVSPTISCRFQDEKREFLKKELEAAHEDTPFKPIFLFQHPHITETVYGSINWGEDDLTDILVNYPQIVDFSGHSHAPVNDPRSVHQRHFTCAGTGSFSYFELDEYDKVYGTVPPLDEPSAQFLIVEVSEEGAVKIKPFDVVTQRFFDMEYLVETPWNPDSFIYTEDRYFAAKKPEFTAEATIDVTVKADGVDFTFDQADGKGERIDDYTLTVRKKEDGSIVRRICFWSKYYLNNMPARLTQGLDLTEKGDYTVDISARGFWFNRSVNKLTTEFTI